MALGLFEEVFQGHVRLIQARLQNLRRVGKDFDLGHAGQIRSFRARVKIGGGLGAHHSPNGGGAVCATLMGRGFLRVGPGLEGMRRSYRTRGSGGVVPRALLWYRVSRWDTGLR